MKCVFFKGRPSELFVVSGNVRLHEDAAVHTQKKSKKGRDENS